MTTTSINTQTLADMIRSWVHFDNLAATFTRQAQQARSARARWEQQVIAYLNSTNMANAIIQIAGGRLTVVEEKHADQLTFKNLEVLLHEYYSKKAPGSDDETNALLSFIKANRNSTTSTRLKKS
jgi:anti-sigma factor RsiW